MAGVFAAGVVGSGGLLAAPAIGGAIGTLVSGYTGAAAASYGLAMLGGGSIAAGGLGMVGGTYVVAAAGAALGSALGANITNAYVSEDKSFAIEKFRDGTGTRVIVARGFSTEKDMNSSSAMQIVEERYPDSPTCRLRWGSIELGQLAALEVRNVGAKQAMGAVGRRSGEGRQAGREEARPPSHRHSWSPTSRRTRGTPRWSALTAPASRPPGFSRAQKWTATSSSATASAPAP
ncbi:hypothetical protein [Rhodococcus kronopolitis]|uniref:Uncharacterized protein n=1 Tax=Rhodococcus kronopolitis TaxID=1460226 RepID=A0ABV9FVK1_9NOCA